MTNGYSDTNLGKVYNYKLIGSTITILAAKSPQPPAVGNYAGPKYGFSVDVVDRYWDTPATCSTVVGAPYAYNSDPNNPGYTKTTGMIEIYKINYSSTPYAVSMLLNQLGNSDDNNSQLGYSVSMIESPGANTQNQDYIFAGAPGYYSTTPGENRGKLHCFTTSGTASDWATSGTWPRGRCGANNYRPCLSHLPTGEIGDRFGESISISGQFAVISYPTASGYGKMKIYGRMQSLEFDFCSGGYNQFPNIYMEMEEIESPNQQSNEKFGFKAATWYYNDISYVENGDPFYGAVSAPFWDTTGLWSFIDLGISYFIDGEVDGIL